MAEQRHVGTGAARPRRQAAGLPSGGRLVWDEHARLWRGGAFVTGGSPWRLMRLGPAARTFARRLQAAGAGGLEPEHAVERTITDLLVDRGVAHPVIEPHSVGDEVVVIIPVYDRPVLLDACLRQLTGVSVVVVDDASIDGEAVRRVAEAHGARLLRHPVNRGPGAARNTGLAATDAPIVAFLDSDCTPGPGWLERLLPYFDDPRVAIVAPRVRPRRVGRSVLARYEHARSPLDMGRRRGLVRMGSPVAYLPSAAMLVRRQALRGRGFEPAMRVGEDVDLVWRLLDAEWQVRYEPSVEVEHEMRLAPREWARRRYQYGTSAGALDHRHPGRLAPAVLSGWNVGIWTMIATRRPALAALVAAAAVGTLAGRLHRLQAPLPMAPVIAGKGLVADTVSLGHALRREWWPLGWVAMIAARRSPIAAAGAIIMLAPLTLEHRRDRPDLGLFRYLSLRLLDDAAYGTGAIAGAVQERRFRVLCPRVRWPTVGIRRNRTRGRAR